MTSGQHSFRKILHQTKTAGYSSPGFNSRSFSGTGKNPPLFQLEEHHYSENLIDSFHEPTPLPPQPGETSITYLLCGSLGFTTHEGKQETMLPGSCLWISSEGKTDAKFVSVTSAIQEFWSVQIRTKTSPGMHGVSPLSCQIPATDIPVHRGEDGVISRVVAGEYEGFQGPLYAHTGSLLFLDVSIPPLTPFYITIPQRYVVFIYCLEGTGLHDLFSGSLIYSSELVRYSQGEGIFLRTEIEEVRLILIGSSETALTQI